MFGKKEPKEEQKPVGGIPFFISIICLVLIAINNICSLPMLIFDRIGTDNFFSLLQNLIAFITIAVFLCFIAKLHCKVNDIQRIIQEGNFYCLSYLEVSNFHIRCLQI